MPPPNLLRLNLLLMLAHTKHILTRRLVHRREARARDIERADDNRVGLVFAGLRDVEGKSYG